MAGQSHPKLKNVSLDQLFEQIEDSLKSIVAKRNNTQERYEIGPEELAQFGGTCPDAGERIEPSAEASLQ
jgi:hypothetical protein